MSARVPIKEALKSKSLTDKEKGKLKLSLSIRKFAENKLKLATTNNYTSYVKLKSKYPTYTISAADKYQLKSYFWSFPFVGKVSYKGFPQKQQAKDEAKHFPKDKYDVYIRGAGAYSTLGWFDDPIFSSMLRYSEHDFVNVIIHETVHATIYIKDHTDFNERIATFIANEGTKKYYESKEGANSKTIALIQKEHHDEKLFSEFLSREMDSLKKWYEDQKTIDENIKEKRLKSMMTKYENSILPRMKSKKYKNFSKFPLNNAALLGLKTYHYDLSDFKKIYAHFNNNFDSFLSYCKKLEDNDDPEKALKDFIANLQSR